MNKIFILGLFLILPHLIQAQEKEFQTIFHKNNNEKLSICAFGGPFMQFTSINKYFALNMGGGGAILINDFFFGGYGVGITNEIPYKYNVDSTMGFGHGGLWIGYTFQSRKSIHLSLSAQVGWGSISKKQKLPSGDYIKITSDPITTITPVAEIELNMTKFFKLGAGASWSYVSGISDSSPYTSKDFSSPAFFLSLKFGWFK
jgi:hypothetical protein